MAKAPTAIGHEVGGKISAKSLGFDKKTLQRMTLDNENEAIPLFRVIGNVMDLQEYKSKFEDKEEEEEGYGLVGQWKITLFSTGEVTELDGVMYIPGPAHRYAVGAVKQGNNVSIALDVYVQYSEKAGTGYTFVNRTLIEPDRTQVNEIEKLIGNTPLPALPAPK